MQKEYWFKRRRYGWGFAPVTWQGWLSILTYLIIVVGSALAFLNNPENVSNREQVFFWIIVVLSTVGILRISLSKGPQPKWRWGKKPTDNPKEDF